MFLFMLLKEGMIRFLSTPSARRATDMYPACLHFGRISIHALREEGDMKRGKMHPAPCKFLSTPSARRATKDSLCMANLVYISIHALREEGDWIAPPSG